MLQDVSIVQQIGVAVLAVATVVWAVGLVRVMRKERFDVEAWRQAPSLRALPTQQGPPRTETVELTADERAAFAGLVRQFGEGRS
ncbi:hypothetical protein ABZ921_07725 [Streptomyces atriruber]|uniref:Uncharacterized protein n=1 Tax=Streptomyces atriruber TaxID=545121 RepID=A0ABV3BHL6_9ACTN|nr:hypothetical protein [Streptomyces sp. KL118A]